MSVRLARDGNLVESVNWLLIVLCAVIVIVTSFFLFYWNRFFAWTVAAILRTFYWKSTNSWIDCDSLQFSILAGRILIKELRYHSRNESVRIVKCHITWRYWFWRTRGETEMNDIGVHGDDLYRKTKGAELPCRVQVSAEGVEWFIYNRTPAYDEILKHMGHGFDDPATKRPSTDPHSPEIRRSSGSQRRNWSRATTTATYPPTRVSNNRPATRFKRSRTFLSMFFKRLGSWIRRQIPAFELQDVLPIGIEAIRGAIVLGNDSTPSIFIAEFKRARGTYGTAQSRSKFDVHKQVYAFKFTDAKIFTRVNRDYDDTMLNHGEQIVDQIQRKAFITPHSVTSPGNFFFKAFHDLAPIFFNQPHKHQAPVTGSWHGLPRYFTVEEKIKQEDTHEYAKLSTILETPLLELTYYSDIPGPVPENPRIMGMAGLETADIGNGDLAPEWGIDLIICGGQINYGPWSDRQRQFLQRAIFPATYQTRPPTEHLQPGQLRMHTAMKVYVEVSKAVTMRVPLREFSKNWRYDGVNGPELPKRNARPFGWFDITIGSNSTVNYLMSMVSNDVGFDNLLQLHIDHLQISSSVNQTRFLEAESCRVLCDMPSPLCWNAEREWIIDTSLSRPNIYLLRDHVTLMTDLAKDWTSGPPTESQFFVPITYVIRLALKDFRLNMYVNDHNIIDLPLEDNQNALLTVTGPSMLTEATIPSTKFRPLSTAIPFWIEAPTLDVSMGLPGWNTNSSFKTLRTESLGKIGLVRVNSSFLYYADVRPDNVDVLRLDINARNIVFKCFGWAVRHLLIVKDNYFGDFTNFSTRSEYFAKRVNHTVGDPVELKYRKGRSNVFQVAVTVNAQDLVMLLPQELHDCRSAAVIALPELQVVLGLHDHFMEIALNTQPFRITAVNDCSSVEKSRVARSSGPSLFVTGLNITGNRLFGPQPHATTYLCLWEIQLGAIDGTISPELAVALKAATTTFGLNFSDALNAPATDYQLSSDPDVTFLKVGLAPINVTLRTAQSAIRISVPHGLSYEMNNLAGTDYQSVKSIVLPLFKFQCLLSGLDEPRGPKQPRWVEVASATFDFHADIYAAPKHWRKTAAKQARFVATQDQPTRRARFLYECDENTHKQTYHRASSLLLPCPVFPSTRAQPEILVEHTDSTSESYVSALEPSDSSGDEDMSSSAYRDAQLAQLRKTTGDSYLGRRVYAEGSISSGDESDNGDSSASTSDDDSSLEHEDNISRDGMYYRVLRKYRELNPRVVNTSPLVLALEAQGFSTAALFREEADTPQPNFNTPGSFFASAQAGPEQPLVLLRLESQRPNEFLITPLLGNSVVQLVDRFQSIQLPLEQRLDSFFVAFLGSKSVSASDEPSKYAIEARLVSWRISTWQKIKTLEGPGGRTVKTLSHRVQSECLSLVVVELDGGFCSGHIMGRQVDIRASLRGARLGLYRAPFHHSSKDISAIIGPCRISILNTDPEWIISPTIGTATISAIESSPELMICTIMALTSLASTLQTAMRAHSKRSAYMDRLLIRELLSTNSQTPMTADPMSWMQVSFMVKSGLPQMLRSDVSWALLSYLRHHLRRLPSNVIQDLEQRLQNTTISPNNLHPELTRLVQDRLGELIYDAEHTDISNVTVFRQLFPRRRIKSTSKESPLDGLCLRFDLLTDTTRIILRDEEPTSNEISIGPINATLRMTTSAMTPINNQSVISLNAGDQPLKVLHILGEISVTQVKLSAFPTSLPFVRRLLRLHRLKAQLSSNPRGATSPASAPSQPFNHPMILELFLDVKEIEARASAQQLSFGAKLGGSRVVTTLTMLPRMAEGTLSMHITPAVYAALNELTVQARETGGSTSLPSERAILASINATSAQLYVSSDGSKVRCTAGLGELSLSVPRSAMRLYRFVEEWKVEYLPTYDNILQDLLSEMERTPSLTTPTPSLPRRRLDVDVQLSIGVLGVTLHIMYGTWLSWRMEHAMGFGRTSDLQSYAFGVQLDSQAISLSAKPDESGRMAPTNSAVKLGLPSVKLSGAYHASRLDSTLMIDSFDLLELKPQYVDDFLAVQQKFGSDFNDILDLFAQSRKKSPATEKSSRPAAVLFQYHIALSFEGFKVGIQGPLSTQYLECSAIRGNIKKTNASDRLFWELSVRNLALSLVHRTSIPNTRSTFDRSNPSAYMVMDCVADNNVPTPNEVGVSCLNIEVNKVHALMVAAAIGELGDLVDHIQAEMLQRKEQRAQELEEIKKKTKRVIDTFDADARRASKAAAFGNQLVSIKIRSIGVAFPLTSQNDIVVPAFSASRAPGTVVVPAFLFSIKSVEFVTQRYETGSARMLDFAFQFVPSFNQSIPDHFAGSSHETLNRMLYPEMTADVRTETSTSARRILVRAAVSGFELDLTPQLASYIFSLVGVYRQGKEYFGRFTPYKDSSPSDSKPKDHDHTPLIDVNYSALPTSDIRLSLEFRSGHVRLHGPSDIGPGPESPRSGTLPLTPDTDLHDLYSSSPTSNDLFDLPQVSVWLEYHAIPASHKVTVVTDEVPPSSLTLNTLIHSSENTIKPSVLPFFIELMKQIEIGLRKESHSPPVRPISVSDSAELATPAMMNTTRINFSLRIDQSNLHLTCQPDVNVVSSLHWQSGGFILTISPGVRDIGFVGSVEGITARLRHGYLVEDCVNARARDLTFSTMFSHSEDADGNLLHTLSIVVDTQLDASVRFGRLQDMLCFKAVWLDHIPVLEFEPAAKSTYSVSASTALLEVEPTPPTIPDTPSRPNGFLTTVLVQIESIKLEVDLGQAITKQTLDIRPVIIRSRLTEALSEISFSLGEVKLEAVRALSGTLTMPSMMFETVRRRKDRGQIVHSKLLELTIRTGEIDVVANYEGTNILVLRADPFDVSVHDDWTRAIPESTSDNGEVQLHFSVEGGAVRAGARIMTVPELIILGGKVRALIYAQQEGAARESTVFRATRSPKPKNPLSDVATAMLQSARSKLKEKDTFEFIVVQAIHLSVSRIRLTIFNRGDTRMTQFEAVGVEGNLLRTVLSQQLAPFRDLKLALQSFEVRSGDMLTSEQWLDFHQGAKVFTMPEMNIMMRSTEYLDAHRLDYDFTSTFPQPKAKGGHQTLYIALDFHKYEQLMAMQNAFKVEFDKAVAEVAESEKILKSAVAVKAGGLKLTSLRQPGATLPPPGPEASALPPVPNQDTTVTTPIISTSNPPDIVAEVGLRGLTFHSLSRVVEMPKLHQLGAASPDLETFKQWTNISIRDSLPVWIHEYATIPIESLMKLLLEVYIKQLKAQDS